MTIPTCNQIFMYPRSTKDWISEPHDDDDDDDEGLFLVFLTSWWTTCKMFLFLFFWKFYYAHQGTIEVCTFYFVVSKFY